MTEDSGQMITIAVSDSSEFHPVTRNAQPETRTHLKPKNVDHDPNSSRHNPNSFSVEAYCYNPLDNPSFLELELDSAFQ